MDICDSTIAFTTKCNIPGRLRVKTTITHQVESPLSEKNIDPWESPFNFILEAIFSASRATESKIPLSRSPQPGPYKRLIDILLFSHLLSNGDIRDSANTAPNSILSPHHEDLVIF